MADGEWFIDTSGLDSLMDRLEQSGNNIEKIAQKAIDATVPIIKGELSRRMPRSAAPRQPRPAKKLGNYSQSWRTGKHAADNVKSGRFKHSLRGSTYKVVGPGTGDNDPYFYMKFFEYGRRVYNRRTKSLGTVQAERPFVQPTLDAVRGQVVDTMKDVIVKEIELTE